MKLKSVPFLMVFFLTLTLGSWGQSLPKEVLLVNDPFRPM